MKQDFSVGTSMVAIVVFLLLTTNTIVHFNIANGENFLKTR
jgi:hypothetical protein